MCVLQCLQSCRNGKRGVMIYSHLAAHHRQRVWPLLFLFISPSLFCISCSILPSLLPISAHLLPLITTPAHTYSFLPRHPLTLLYYTDKTPHFQLSPPYTPWPEEEASVPPTSRDCLTITTTVRPHPCLSSPLLMGTTHFTLVDSITREL